MSDGDGGEERVDVMTDADFDNAMEALQYEGGDDVGELLRMMNENRMISWEEAEQILGGTPNEPIKSSLPQQTRPTEPDNDTDVDRCIQKLLNNDPSLREINLNNMKRTPIPQIKRVIDALRSNTHLEKLSLANLGLYDMDVALLIDVLPTNETLRSLNLETNYLSGDFFAKLFQAALPQMSLEEIKAVNQGVSFSTQAEREIIDAVLKNKGLTKISINLRLPEGRYKIEQASIRNQEIRRILRRQQQQEQKGTASSPAAAPATSSTAKKDDKKLDTKSLRAPRASFESPLAVAGATSALSAGKALYEKTQAEAAAKKAAQGMPNFAEKRSGAVSDRTKALGSGCEKDATSKTPSLGAIGKRTSTEKIAERMRKFEGKNQQPPPPPPGVLAAPPVQEPPPRRGPQGVGAIASAVAAKAAARRQVSFSDDVDEAPRSGPQGKAKQTAASSTGAAKDSEKPRQPAVARARTETTSSTASSASSTDTKGPRKSSPTKQAGTSSPSSSPKTKPRASAVKPVQIPEKPSSPAPTAGTKPLIPVSSAKVSDRAKRFTSGTS